MNTEQWKKSSRSSSSGSGQCVEVALNATVSVRDSKLDTTGDFPRLTMPRDDWQSLIDGLRHDELA